MTRRLLIPLDDLDAEHPALRFAQVNFPGAHLHLLHVLGILPPPGLVADISASVLAGERQRLHAIGDGEVVAFGDPSEVILDRARGGAFDLIVMGTARKGRLERFFLGSVAEAVVRQSPLPILTVRDPAGPAAPIRRLLVLHDFSPAADCALGAALDLWPEADVELMHAYIPGSLTSPFALKTPAGGNPAERFAQSNRDWRREAQVRLDGLGGGLVREREPAQLALASAASGQVDLIAMGTASRLPVDRWLFGSVAQQVVRESPVPVLTVHAGGRFPGRTGGGGATHDLERTGAGRSP